MLLLTLAAVAAATTAQSPQARPQIEAVRQARATVRILSGALITAQSEPAEALVREVGIVASDGSYEPARLVEFP